MSCIAVLQALRIAKLVRVIGGAASAAFAAAALTIAALATGAPSMAAVWCFAFAALLGAAAAYGHNLVRQLTFVGYRHFEHR
jgi:hypothetical protein